MKRRCNLILFIASLFFGCSNKGVTNSEFLEFNVEKMAYTKEVAIGDTLRLPISVEYSGAPNELSFSTSDGVIIGDSLLQFVPQNSPENPDLITITVESESGLSATYEAQVTFLYLNFDTVNTKVPLVLFAGDSLQISIRFLTNMLDDSRDSVETNFGEIVDDTVLVLSNNGQNVGKKLIQLKIPGVDSCEFPINVVSEKPLSVGDHWRYESLRVSGNYIYPDSDSSLVISDLTVLELNNDNAVVRVSVKEGEGSDSLDSSFYETTHTIDLSSLNDSIFTDSDFGVAGKAFVERVLSARILKYYSVSSSDSSLNKITLEENDFWTLHLHRQYDYYDDLENLQTLGLQNVVPGVGVTSIYEDFITDPYSENYRWVTISLLSMNGE